MLSGRQCLLLKKKEIIITTADITCCFETTAGVLPSRVSNPKFKKQSGRARCFASVLKQLHLTEMMTQI